MLELVVCDIVTLDSALQNNYAEIVISGKPLPINYSTYVSQFQSITSSDFAINVSRAVTRLKSVFINFDGGVRYDGDGVASNDTTPIHKKFNTFVHPMKGPSFAKDTAIYDSDKEVQWQIQIGSTMFPEYPVRGIAETFYQLKKSLRYSWVSFSKSFNHTYTIQK